MSAKNTVKNEINIPVKKPKINSFTKKITLNTVSDEALSPKKQNYKESVFNKSQLSNKNIKSKEESQNNSNKNVRKYTLDANKNNPINLEEVTNMIKKVEIKIMSLDEDGVRSQSRKKSKNLNNSQESNLLQLLKSKSDVIETKPNVSVEKPILNEDNIENVIDSISNVKAMKNSSNSNLNTLKTNNKGKNNLAKSTNSSNMNKFNNKFIKKEEIYLEIQDKKQSNKDILESKIHAKRGFSNKSICNLNLKDSNKENSLVKSGQFKPTTNNKYLMQSKLKEKKDISSNNSLNNSINFGKFKASKNNNVNKSISINDISKIDNNEDKKDKNIPIVEADLLIDNDNEYCNNSFINQNDSMLLNDFLNTGSSVKGDMKKKMNKNNIFHLNLDISSNALSNPNFNKQKNFNDKDNKIGKHRLKSNNTKLNQENKKEIHSKNTKLDSNKSSNTLNSSINSNNSSLKEKRSKLLKNKSFLENSNNRSDLNESNETTKNEKFKNNNDLVKKTLNKRFLVKTNNINLFEYTDNNINVNKSLSNSSHSLSHKNFKLQPKAQSPLKELKDTNYIDLLINIKNKVDSDKINSEQPKLNQNFSSSNTISDNKNIIHINNIINIYSSNKIEDILDEINGLSQEKLNSNFQKVNISKKLFETREKNKINNLDTNYIKNDKYNDLATIKSENKIKKYKSFNYNYNLTEESKGSKVENEKLLNTDMNRLERINLISTYKQNRSTSPVELLSKIRNTIKETN